MDHRATRGTLSIQQVAHRVGLQQVLHRTSLLWVTQTMVAVPFVFRQVNAG
jgi:hypothetical protein